MIQTKIEEMVDLVELQLNHQTLGQNFTIEIGEQGSKGGGCKCKGSKGSKGSKGGGSLG